jgi:hypothetical protein
MASELETLQSIRTSLLEQIESLTESPRPNYSVDGQSVSWQSLYDSLWDKLQRVNEQIAQFEGPFEIETRGCT